MGDLFHKIVNGESELAQPEWPFSKRSQDFIIKMLGEQVNYVFLNFYRYLQSPHQD